MFVQDFVYLDADYNTVCERLAAFGQDGTLASSAAAVYRDGEELLTRVGPGDSAGVSKTVRLEMGPTMKRGDGVVFPLTWTATGAAALFPQMEADLEVAPFGDGRVQVSLLGRYRVPLGRFGRRLDELVLHRVAQATVREFLLRVAAYAAGDQPVPAATGEPR